MPIDLRSDTVTRPTPAMRAAMAAAEVGDDTFGEDPTVLRLEQRMCELTGFPAALFVPSGHMGNQLCLRAHSQPGDSVICHAGAHIVNYESGALCALSGLQPFTIQSAGGTFTTQEVEAALQPPDMHRPRNRIVALENTHNRCGGAIWPLELLREVCRFARERGLAVHVDGARLWNACIATDTRPTEWLAGADSVSMCFSKGLGAPVGSCIAGGSDFIERCRFFRKMFGGQMRQAGVLAAAALYAVEHHWERIADDHANAGLLAELLADAPGLSCLPVQSNIVIVEVDTTLDGPVSAGGEGRPAPAARLVGMLAELGVQVFNISPTRIRAVTHLDVTTEQVRQAAEAMRKAARSLFAAAA